MVTVKVDVTLEPLSANSILLADKARLVKAENDPVFEDSHQVRSMGKAFRAFRPD